MAMNHPDPAPGTGTTSGSTKLGCGRDLNEVWDNLGNPPDAHEATCPDCQAARADLAGLYSASRTMVVNDLADPSLRTAPAALDGIIAIARSEVRRGRTIPLRQPSLTNPGQLSVSEQSIATLVRRTADALPDIEARRCNVTVVAPTAQQAQSDAGAATQIRVQLIIAVTPAVPIPDVVNALRAAVIDTAAAEVGVQVVVVDVQVDDIVTDDDLAEAMTEEVKADA